MKKLLAYVALLAPTLSLPAQVGSEKLRCPHQVIQWVAGDTRATNPVPCGTGISFERAGVRYTSQSGTCALVITVTPPHNTTTFREGSNTYTEPGGPVYSFVLRYRCEPYRFLWLITISSECVEVGFQQAGRLDNYSQFACRD